MHRAMYTLELLPHYGGGNWYTLISTYPCDHPYNYFPIAGTETNPPYSSPHFTICVIITLKGGDYMKYSTAIYKILMSIDVAFENNIPPNEMFDL